METIQLHNSFLKKSRLFAVLSVLLTCVCLLWPSRLLAAGGPGGVGDTEEDSTLRLWLRPDVGLYTDIDCSTPASIGASIACWGDQSGYGLDMIQTDPTLRPVYRSSRAVEFSMDVLTSTYPVQLFAAPNAGLSLIVAFKSSVYTQTSVLLNHGASAALNVNRNVELGYTFGDNGDFGLHRGQENATVAATERITAEQPIILSTMVLTSGVLPTTSMRLHYNGSPVVLSTLTDGWLTSGTYPTTTVSLDIGARLNGNLAAYPDVEPDAFHEGDISEIVVFTTTLNTAQQIIIENYLSAKYAIPLSAEATKYAHSTYIRDVIGIGRETDGMHTEARGAGLILSDSGYLQDAGDYVMAGHRTPVNAWDGASLPTGVSSRWKRDWYFDKRDVGNNGGAVTVKFDFSEGGIEDSPNGIYVLLERPGTFWSFRVVQASSYIIGDQVIFPHVTGLKNGWLYTLGEVTHQDYLLEDSWQPDGPAFNFEDISTTGTEIVFESEVSNEMTGTLPLGFLFNFYDNSYSDIYLSTNGFITFLPGQQPSDGESVPIPTNDGHNGLIAGWWNNLDMRSGGEFYYQTKGIEPNRYFIVQYHELSLGTTGITSTFQIKLFESSNAIEIHYLEAKTQSNDYSMAGIENESGTKGLQYYYADQNLSSLAVRYSRPPLLLEKVVNDLTPRVGDRITHTLVVRSNLLDPTTAAVVSDTLDIDMVFATQAITVTPPQPFNITVEGQRLLLDGFTLGAGQRITFTVPVTVSVDATLGRPLLNTALLMHPSLPAPRTRVVRIVPDNCWVNLNGVVSDQVQPALDLAVTGDEIKIAGYCLDIYLHPSGAEQVAYISKTLTLRGGYTPTDWTMAYPTATTTFDARGQGRVAFITPGITVTLANLHLINGDAFEGGDGQNYGGGLYAANTNLNLHEVQVYDNVAALGGGMYISGGALNWAHGAAMTNTATTSGGGIYFANNANGRLTDVVLRANKLENSTASGQGGAGLYALDSTLVLGDYMRLDANAGAYQGGGGYVENTQLTAQQIIIQKNDANRGGGIFFNNSTAILTDLDVRHNNAWSNSGHGAGLYFLFSSAEISTSQFISNTANGRGGAIYVDRTDALLVTSVISDNYSRLEGGGLYANAVASMTLRANDILNNRGASGSGIYVNTGTPYLNNNRFMGNQTPYRSGNGGGIMLYRTTGARLTDNLFANNIANHGGGLYLTTDTAAILTDNQVLYNQASAYGGGFHLRSSNVYVTRNQVMTNTSANLGGGIYSTAGIPQYIENVVSFNSAINGGGGVYCAGGSPQLIDNLLEFNSANETAFSYGGGIQLENTSGAQANGNWFRENVSRRGGGLYVRDTGNALMQLNTVLSNTANLGGGMFVQSGIATSRYLTNTIAFNTVSGSSNRGAGVFVNGGATSWESNTIYSNTAELRGGGVYINSSSATFRNNLIVFNRALNTTDSGGGVFVYASTVALVSNQILTNTTPGLGGGIYLNGAATNSILQQNTFAANTAAKGGGLFVYRGRPTLIENRVLRNMSTGVTDSGGGIYVYTTGSDLISLLRNVIQENRAQGRGGGMYITGAMQDIFDGNVLFANTAESDGGGLFLINTTAQMLNTVVADNASISGRGGGIYLSNSNVPWLHATIANNSDAYQVGIHVQDRSPFFTNTIFISHTVGISIAQGAVATFNATLWGNLIDADGPGDFVTYGPSVTGDPDFQAVQTGDYRIGANSVARDTGVPSGVTTDMDGASRPMHLGYDLGASEYNGACFVRLNQSTHIYSTIQAAVNASNSPDDLIKVAGTCAGVQTIGATTQAVYVNKSLTIQGGYTLTQWLHPDPAAYPTVVDAMDLGRTIYVAAGVDVTVRGLHIQGGNATVGGGPDAGGGVYADNATLTLQNVHISNNQAADGGGVMGDAATIHIMDSQIFDNAAVNGGGLYADNAALYVTLSHVFDNTATHGGGVYLFQSAAAQIAQNTLHHNTANRGGALYLVQSPSNITSNQIYANTSARGGGLYLEASDARVVNNVVVDNTASDLGSGLYLDASAPYVLHVTMARNQGAAGSGIHLANNSTASITNTVLISHTVGLNVEAGSEAALVATYWGNGEWANGMDWVGAGSVISQLNYYDGDPGFVAPQEQDYHITGASALVNLGVPSEVEDDLDGFPRDRLPDLGADEYRTCWVRLNDDPTDYINVQEAVDAAQLGDVVKIAGRCSGVTARPRNDLTTTGLVTQVVYLTQTLTLQGGYAAKNFTHAYPLTQPTFLDALGAGRVVYVANDAQPILAGLQLTGGDATGQGGHSTGDAGGGLYAAHATVTVDACQFYDNVADWGSAIHVALGQVDLRNTTIGGNQTHTGGALHTWESDLYARHTTLAQNTGIGVYLEGAGTAWLTNTILFSHTVGITATNGATAWLQATLWGNDLDWDVNNTAIQTAADYWGDPGFISPAARNYRLRGISAAIDHGMDAGLAMDGDGKMRPIGAGYDLGADEFQAAFVLSKHASPALVLSGERITYTLYLTNTGLLPLQVAVVDHLPEHSHPKGILNWTAWPSPGEVWMQQFPVDVDLGYVGPLTNTVFATATLGMVAQAESVVQTVLESDLAITKTVVPTVAEPGDWITYTLEFKNIGGSPAFSVVVSDTIPTALESLSVTATRPITAFDSITYTWHLGTLAPDEHGIITVTGQVRTGTAGGTAILNGASIAGALIEDNLTNNYSGPVTTNVLNVAPLAVNDVVTTAEDTPLLIAVLDNDIDLNGDTLFIVALSPPQNGQASILATAVMYTPTQDFYGEDSFTYVMSDGVITDTATVYITVMSVNDPPVAIGDDYTTLSYLLLEVDAPGVLLNDLDMDDDPLTAELVSDPGHGTVTLSANGRFVYTPTLNFNGVDTFTYRAYDGLEYSNEADVTITVTANFVPVAADDAFHTFRNQALSVTAPGVLDNDSDADDDTLTAEQVSDPVHGTVALASDGSFVYTPTAGFTGVDTFTYRAYDGLNYSNVATVAITVENRPPVAEDDAYSTSHNQALTVAAPGVLDNDNDADGDTLTVEQTSESAHGTVEMAPDGGLVYTPTTGFAGVDTFTYRAYDGLAYSNSAAVTITVIADSEYTLTIDKEGEGIVTPPPGVYTHTHGTSVDLIATATTGWVFSQWSGDASGTLTQTQVLMDSDKVVTAVFALAPPHNIYLPLILRAR